VSDQNDNTNKLSSELIWQNKQHEVLFALIDRIQQKNAGLGIFIELRDYADSHFCIEEAYMLQLDYPDAEPHFRAHEKFRQELQCLVDDTTLYDANANRSLADFLAEWLRRHIFGLDKQLEKFILESRFK
jgi:hemerythrin